VLVLRKSGGMNVVHRNHRIQSSSVITRSVYAHSSIV
jgi:hypothetical protein